MGAGRLELILAARGLDESRVHVLEAPQLDLTLGLLDGLDLALVGAPSFSFASGESDDVDASFIAGLKWQPIAGARWAASITPAVTISALTAEEFAILLPAQVEVSLGRVAVGVDGGYGFVSRAPDEWHAGLYASLLAGRGVTLLAESLAFSSPATEHTDVVAGLGLDWAMPWGFHWLAMGGTGLYSSQGQRVRWTGYLGLQWQGSLWGTAASPRSAARGTAGAPAAGGR